MPGSRFSIDLSNASPGSGLADQAGNTAGNFCLDEYDITQFSQP
jgi:hypothetical protein